MSLAENIYQAICSCPDECKLHARAESCGQVERDAALLAMLEPQIIYYGPHPCESCSKQICKVAQKQGGMSFDYPEGIIYPNTNWVQHVCARAVAPVETPKCPHCVDGKLFTDSTEKDCPTCVETRLTARAFWLAEEDPSKWDNEFDFAEAFRDKSEVGSVDNLVIDICRELYDRFVMGGWEPRDSHQEVANMLAPLQANAKKAWQLASNLGKERTELRAKLGEQETRADMWQECAFKTGEKLKAAEAEAASLRERERLLRSTVEWIAAQQDLFFAECSQPEEIVERCKEALSAAPERP